jgi:radical SAM superfamily enzyme YgiQ (UPF0313 family)
MNVLLISTYELGRQPFGLASPAAWLREAGHEVHCQDLSQERLNPDLVREAPLVGFYLPMHTATRIALRALDRVVALNPEAHVCCYGLYAPVNAELLRSRGTETILGGEFESDLLDLANAIATGENRKRTASRRASEPSRQDEAFATGELSTQTAQPQAPKLRFRVPDRAGLPPLHKYARLRLANGESRVVGYTEASRGCRHFCRHCPVVPVYNGTFRIVQREVVLEDVRRQVVSGAEHITFGDPDFFNGPGHAVAIVEALHREFPAVTYDVTIKIEHLLKFAEHLPMLRNTNCAFVTTAVESIDDRVLALLEKGHTRADFVRAVELMRKVGLPPALTFIPFTPWTTLSGYCELLRAIAQLDLVENVAPVQLAIRLLIPCGSRLLELPAIRERIVESNPELLSYQWRNRDPRVDELQKEVEATVAQAGREDLSRSETFTRVWQLAAHLADERGFAKAELVPAGAGWKGRAQLGKGSGRNFSRAARPASKSWTSAPVLPARTTIPYLTEPWYC